ncbi:IMC sub-compartment ISP1 [Cryptosporidium sp. chipmunk genotype I]|uniref:IMC sub-compartment ISP1 n=1 Tax=Cryptosporidium sp. chipmunk genotype I TaxID=1280935 RepID=UPI00351A03A5|nr:IMC sub-compartment ISP1 [Cryptosporidium sp. chipmunk genotype I]
MLEIISEIFRSCCTLKKNQKDDEYIFILCPAPSDLEEEYIDEEGNVKKKKLKKIRGTARNIVDNEIVREWSGREIGSCICCHLIYEDEMNIYRADKYGKRFDKDEEECADSILRHKNINSVESLNLYNSKKHFSEEPNTPELNSTLTSSDENINKVENKSKKVIEKKKLNISKSSTVIEKELDEKEKNKNKKRIETKDVNNKECSTISSDSITDLNSTDDNIANDGIDSKSIENTSEKNEQQISFPNSKKYTKSSSISKNQSFPKLGKRPPLKSELLTTYDQKNKSLNPSITSAKKCIKKISSSQKNEANQISLKKEKVDENNACNTHGDNRSQTNDSDNLAIDRITSHSDSDEDVAGKSEHTKYEEEEMKFNKDISSKIIRHRASIGIQAEIILKDGSIMNCKVSFSDKEDDLSFICNDKVKAVPWSNIKEIFTTKNELRMVNTRAPIFKDPTLIIALHLKDTGNCIPLKFNSKQGKEEFLNFAFKIIR